MKSFQVYLALLIVTFVFIGCNPDQEDQETGLFAHYEIRYLQQERQLRAQANFSRGDSLTRKPTTFPTVNFGKYKMEKRNLKSKGIRYQYKKNMAYESPLSFRIIDKNNQEIHHQIAMSPIDSFYLEGIIDKSQDLKLHWRGTPLQSNETLVLLFTDQKNRAASQVINGPTDASTITISSKSLTDLSVGKGELYLVKKQQKRQVNQAVQSTSFIEFYTRSIDIEVKDGGISKK